MENKFNSSNSELMGIFPIPLLKTELPTYFSSLTHLLDSFEMVDNNNVGQFGRRSKNSYILNLPEFSELSDYILTLSLQFGREALNLDSDSYKFSQSWITHKEPGQSHAPHSHANSIISGVFYYGKWVDSLPSINFHSYPCIENQLRPKRFHEPSPNFPDIITLKVYPGQLLLFPSTLMHSVSENNTNVVRKSIAFNIVPTQGLGNEGELTELKLN